MSKSLKVLALVLAALLAVSVFAGCKKNGPTSGSSAVQTQSEVEGPDGEGDNKDNESGAANTESGDENNSNADDNNADENNSNASQGTASTPSTGKIVVKKTGWPIVNQKLTFEIMGISNPVYGNPKEMSMFKYYEKKSNIAIKFTGIASAEIESKKALVMQSKDYPDMFAFHHNTFSDYELSKYGSEGAFADVSKYLKDYAPNIYAELDRPVNVALNQNPDGSIYTIPNNSINPSSSNYDHWLNINKVWLDELGLDIPTTTTEFLEVMRAFRDEDPNGNGQHDEIPYANWNWAANIILIMWGSHNGEGNVGVDNSGKVYYPMISENAHQACIWWHDFLAEDGLMQGDIVGDSSGNWAKFTTHIKSGKVGCFNWSYLSSTSFDSELLKQYVAIPYPTSEYKNPKLNLPSVATPYGSVPERGAKIITKACKSVPALLRYYDYLYTDEGVMLANWGSPENGLYKKNSDGSYTILTEDASKRYSHALGYLMRAGETNCLSKPLVEPSASDNAVYNAYQKAAVKTYANAHKKDPGTRIPNVIKTAQELKDLSKYDAFTGSSGWLSRFVTGSDPLSNWTTFVQDYEKKGIDKYLATYQKIVDRNKKYLFKTNA